MQIKSARGGNCQVPLRDICLAMGLDDPKNYSKPWSITGFWKLRKDWTLDAHPCTLSAIKEYEERVNHADKLPGRDYGAPDKK